MSSKSVSARQPMRASRELLEYGIAIPYALPLPMEDSWTVAYKKPTNICIAGSWVTKSGIKSRDNDIRWTVDLALEMPAVSSYSTSRRKGDLVNVNSLGVVSRKRLPWWPIFPQEGFLSCHHCCGHSKLWIYVKRRCLVYIHERRSSFNKIGDWS